MLNLITATFTYIIAKNWLRNNIYESQKFKRQKSKVKIASQNSKVKKL